jgi:hypothetical protein
MRRLIVVTILLAFTLAALAPANAAGPYATVTVTAGQTVTFTVADLSNNAVAGSTTIAASITYTTTNTGTGGTVVITPPASLTSGTDTLSTTNFTVTCTRTSGGGGFNSLGAVALNGSTTCATLAKNKTDVTTNFSITLTLNDTTSAPSPFTAANFGPAAVSVDGTAS